MTSTMLSWLVPNFGKPLGPAPGASPERFFSYYGVEELAVDKPTPPFALPPLPAINYDPIHDEFTWVEEEQPSQAGASLLACFFGTVVAISALRTALLTKRSGWFRRLLTTQMGEAPPPVHDYRKLRDAFTSVAVPTPKPLENHSHGTSAGNRLAALKFMNCVCTILGMDRFSYQMSSSEQKNGLAGERTYFWAKDIGAEPRFDPPGDSAVITLVDVDYYIDMPSFLAENARPVMVYTIIPETAGRQMEDYHYSFDSDSAITWRVNGGAMYHHQLWNYGTDTFVASLTWWGIPYKTVVYDVQSQRMSPDKAVVLLSPMRTFYGVLAPIVHYMGRGLRRLNTAMGSFSKVVAYTKTGKTVSVASQNTETSATVPGSLFDSLIAQRNNSSKKEIANYAVKSFLEKGEIESRELVAPILTSYLNGASDSVNDPVYVTDVSRMVRVAFGLPDDVDKPKLEAFAAPFGVPPAFVPMNNEASSEQSIAGRVILPRETVAELLGPITMTPFKYQVLDELLHHIIPEPHQGVPYDIDAIAELQVKPGQKRDLATASTLGAALSLIVSTFMKAEAYEKPTDPRNITTFNPRTKIDYAAFVYALAEGVFKRGKWYAFAKSPRTVAERVAEICSKHDSVICPDFHRMDGHVNEICRLAEQAVGRRFFAPEYHAQWDDSHSHAYNNTGVTEHGLRYEQGYSRGSGEMGTSVFNSFLNLLVAFYALRIAGMSNETAWKSILESAVLGGDDGLFGGITAEQMTKSGKAWGFFLKVPAYKRKDMKYGVNFLARIYGPEVWNGNPSSMCSPRRQLGKFHLTVGVPLSAAEKLREKCISFSFTDANTPVFSQLIAAVTYRLPSTVVSGYMSRWGDQHDASEQYPNEYGDWMQAVITDELPLTNVPALIAWLESRPTLAELLDAPPFYETGREYTYTDWDAEDGILIAKAKDILSVRKTKSASAAEQPKPKKTKASKAPDASTPAGEVKA